MRRVPSDPVTRRRPGIVCHVCGEYGADHFAVEGMRRVEVHLRCLNLSGEGPDNPLCLECGRPARSGTAVVVYAARGVGATRVPMGVIHKGECMRVEMLRIALRTNAMRTLL